MIRELIYIIFLHSGISTLGLYPEEIVSKHFFFQWPARTKILCMYQNMFKEVNGDQRYLIFPDLLYNNFEVLGSEIPLDKADL